MVESRASRSDLRRVMLEDRFSGSTRVAVTDLIRKHIEQKQRHALLILGYEKFDTSLSKRALKPVK